MSIQCAFTLLEIKSHFNVDGLRLVTMVYVTRRNVDGLRWLMMDEYVRLCTICEDKLCSNLPRESNRIIFQSEYYLAGSV